MSTLYSSADLMTTGHGRALVVWKSMDFPGGVWWNLISIYMYIYICIYRERETEGKYAFFKDTEERRLCVLSTLKYNSQLRTRVYWGIAEGLQLGTCKLWQTIASLEITKEDCCFIEKRRKLGGKTLEGSPLEESQSPGWWWFLIGWVVVFSYWLNLLLGKEVK